MGYIKISCLNLRSANLIFGCLIVLVLHGDQTILYNLISGRGALLGR